MYRDCRPLSAGAICLRFPGREQFPLAAVNFGVTEITVVRPRTLPSLRGDKEDDATGTHSDLGTTIVSRELLIPRASGDNSQTTIIDLRLFTIRSVCIIRTIVNVVESLVD